MRYLKSTTITSAQRNVANGNPNTHSTCPFARNIQRPILKLAIARALEQEDMAERAWYGICAHDQNREIISLRKANGREIARYEQEEA